MTVIGIVVILAIAVFWYHSPSLPVHFLLPALVVRTLQMLQQLTEAIGTIVLIGLICFVILLLRLQATSDRASRGGEFPRSRFYRQIQHGTCAECGKPARPLAFYEYQYARGERVIDKLCRDCAVRFDAQRVHPPMSYADVD